jgi:uncharacterized protein YbaP (TraB family)
MKYRIAVILILLSVSFCSPAQENKGAYSLLWQISGKGLKKPSYLFGTMHLRDSRVFEFSDSVLAKLDACEGFAIEIHPDSLVGGRFSYIYYDEKGIPVSTVVRDSSNLGLEELKYHTPYIVRSFYERSRRWDLDKPVFLDAYLFNLAKKQGKKTLAVETIEEHLNLADHVSAIDIGLKFKFKLNLFSNDDESDDYIDVYRSGNIYKLDSFMQRSWYNKASLFNILDKRNFVMARRADSLVQIRSTFIAVGAAHLPGENGLISLLQKKGYTVKRVPATFTNYKNTYVLKEKDIPWYELRQDHHGYSIQVPGIIYAGSEKPDTFKLHTFVDSGNNLVYNTFCINYSNYKDSANGKSLIRKIIISALESEGEPEQNYKVALKSKKTEPEKKQNKIVYVKDISQQGIPGKDVVIKCTDSLFLRMQIFDYDHKIYVNRLKLPEEFLESPSSTKFFNSFRIYPAKPYKAVKPVEYKSNGGGFAVNFRNTPMRNKITYYKKPGDTLTDNYTEHYLITANLPERTYSYVMYSDNESGITARTDSAVLDHLMDSQGKLYSRKIGKIIKINEKGISGIEQNFRDWDETKVKVRCYTRGTRNYILADKYQSESDKDSIDKRPFIDSFRFEDFKSEKLKPFTFKNDGISMLLPAAPFISRDTIKIISRKKYNYYDEGYHEEFDYDNYDHYSRNQNFPKTGSQEGIDIETHFESIDKNNGSTFRMNIQHFSKYYRTENIDSLYKSRLASFKNNSDSITNEKDFMIRNIKGRELTFYTDSLCYNYKLRMILSGDQLYTWTARTPKELDGLKHLDAFMGSVDIDPPKNPGNIKSSKASLILADLISGDSTTALNASVALRNYIFYKNEYPDIYKALSRNYPDDTIETRGIRSTLLFALRDSSNENTRLFLDSLYPGLKAYPWLQANTLAVYAASGSKASLNSFFEHLNKRLPDISDNHQARHIFDPLYDSTEKIKEYFDKLAALLVTDNKYISAEISNLLRFTVFKDSIPDRSLVDRNKGFLIAGLKKNLEAYKNAPDTLKADYTEILENISSMLYLMNPDEAVNEITQKLIKSKDLETQLNACLALIRHGKKVNTKMLSNMLHTNNYQAYQFIRKVSDINKMQSLPKEFCSQRKVAELALWNYFFDSSDGIPDSLSFLKEKIITYKGEKVRVYVFRFIYEHNEDFEYLAISGPQPMDSKKFNFDDRLTTHDWRSWSNKTTDERIDAMIAEQIKSITEEEEK